MRLFAVILLLLVSALCVAAPVQVGDARITELPDGTQVVFELDGPVKYNSFLLENPPRFVVDIGDAQPSQALKNLKLRSAEVRGVRTGIRAGVDLRIVLDLKKLTRSEVHTLKVGQKNNRHLVLDIYRNRKPDPATMRTARKDPAPAKSRQIARAKPKPKLKLAKRRDIVIAIDPGHGGKDPGAVGPRKTKEKHVVMQIAKRLKKLVDKERGMRAILTRKSDKYLRLYQRIEIARKHQADLFISIHADAFEDPQANGSSVFILSTKGASSAAARWLAKKENESDLIGGGSLNMQDEDLKPVVFDIYHDAILADSMQLAKKVLTQLRKVGKVRGDSVERAGFAVLKSPDIPSILVETAFISNPKEEAKLRTARHQQKMAQAIMKGIRAYFRQRPRRQPGVTTAYLGH